MTATIGQHIEALGSGRGYPAEAVDACVRHGGQAAPILLALLRRAARGLPLGEDEADRLFLGLHILARLRDEASCAPLLRLLRQPSDTLDDLLGDAVGETLPKIVAGVYDGDAGSLFDMIADPTVDAFVREALWCAAVTLTLQGRIAAEAMAAFIASPP